MCNINATGFKVSKINRAKDPRIRTIANHFRFEKSQIHESMETKCGKDYQTARTRGKWSLRKNV